MQKPLIPGGYINISRKIVESEIWNKPPMYVKVWLYLLVRAQHSEYKGLERGQLRTSIPEIIEACSWKVGYRTEKPTKKQVFAILDWLRNPSDSNHEGNNESSMIETTKGTQGMLVTICNYNVYQDSKNYEGNNEGDAKGTPKEQRKERQGNNINKNDLKNGNNEQENKYIHALFEHWVSTGIYRHTKLTDRMKSAIRARLKVYSFEDLKKAIDNYSKVYKSDMHYFNHKYPLADFMREKDLEKFLDEADPLNNYRNRDYKTKQQAVGYDPNRDAF